MIEVTLLRDGAPTRFVRMNGLYESSADLMPDLFAKLPGPDRTDDVSFRFTLVEEVAPCPEKAGEYELVRPAEGDKPEVRAWAMHTMCGITVRCNDYDLLLELYTMLLLWHRWRLDSYRTERSKADIQKAG